MVFSVCTLYFQFSFENDFRYYWCHYQRFFDHHGEPHWGLAKLRSSTPTHGPPILAKKWFFPSHWLLFSYSPNAPAVISSKKLYINVAKFFEMELDGHPHKITLFSPGTYHRHEPSFLLHPNTFFYSKLNLGLLWHLFSTTETPTDYSCPLQWGIFVLVYPLDHAVSVDVVSSLVSSLIKRGVQNFGSFLWHFLGPQSTLRSYQHSEDRIWASISLLRL